MSNPYLGEIKLFAGNFAPAGWALCQGQLMAIAQNDLLFTLIGTTYGGDGQNTFALPDLQGRVPIHMADGFALGASGGVEQVAINVGQLPMHSHGVGASSNPGTQPSPQGALPAALANAYSDSTTTNTPMAGPMLTPTGGSQPHENMQPYLVINYIISLFGSFPQS